MNQDTGWNDLPTLSDPPTPLTLGRERDARLNRFRRYREHVYAEAAAEAREIDREFRLLTPPSFREAPEVLGRWRELNNNPFARYESELLPAHRALHEARMAGDAQAWAAAMDHAESLMPAGWDARTVAAVENGRQGGRPPGPRPLSDRMQLRLYADQRERLEALGVNVNEWIREAVDERLNRK